MTYAPETARYLSFAAARSEFAAWRDSPCAFLKRCIETIECREDVDDPSVARIRSTFQQRPAGLA